MFYLNCSLLAQLWSAVDDSLIRRVERFNYSQPIYYNHFLVVFDFEEIPISDAELQDSILAKQTFVCDGRMKTSGMPNVPKHTPGQ